MNKLNIILTIFFVCSVILMIMCGLILPVCANVYGWSDNFLNDIVRIFIIFYLSFGVILTLLLYLRDHKKEKK